MDEDKTDDTQTYGEWLSEMTWESRPGYIEENTLDYIRPYVSGITGYRTWDLTELAKQWYRTDTSDGAKRVVALVPTNKALFADDLSAWIKFRYRNSSTPPVFTVVYRSAVGIEPYYTYTTMSAGNAGTAHLSDATGQLKVVKELVSYASAINPFSLNLVYNSDHFTDSRGKAYLPMEELGLNMDSAPTGVI